MKNLHILLLYILISFTLCANKVCLNPEGKKVDWYAIFLFPENSSSEEYYPMDTLMLLLPQ